MIARPAALLTDGEVARVHEASLAILEDTGLLVRHPRAREILGRHGCRVDGAEGVVRFPAALVERHRASIPARFTFVGREPRHDRTLPDDAPIFATGSSAPDLVDPVSGRTRRALAADVARIAHLVQSLDGYDVFSISTLADDAPPGGLTLTRLYAALRYCAKPVRVSGPPEEVEEGLRLAAEVAGGETAYRERPFVTLHYCPVVSPLAMDVDSTEVLLRCAEAGRPGYPSVVPNGGLTAPLSLAGTLAQGNAEFLAVAVLEQMVRPGKPTVYSGLPTIADMRTGAYASGAIETGILLAGLAQLARFYGVPCGGYIGLTNAKANDAQSGLETGMSAVAGLLAGLHLFNTGGLLDALMTFDFAKAVIDDEAARMLRRLRAGIPVSDPELARDVIAAVGPGGMFADSDHALERLRTAALLPEVADRSPRAVWEEAGRPDAQARALRRVREILTADAPGLFSPDLDARLRETFAGLVAARLAPPDGWERPGAVQR